MQSAFVDVGLERDAFLYVTDFMELEDPEETDEVEKAATTGNQAPREVRRNAAPESARSEQKPAQKTEQKTEQKPEQKKEQRPAKERRLLVESAPEADEVVAQEPAFVAEAADSSKDDSDEPGAKRWRGRRRRRGGRGAANAPEEAQATTSNESSKESPSTYIEEVVEFEPEEEVAPEIYATAAKIPDNK